MKLYYAPGACSLSPHIILRELGVDFDLEQVDLAAKRTARGADFRALNPKGYVPALELDDGEVLTEGVAIVQYLADRFAPGQLAPPAGTVERARLLSHLNFVASELHKAFGPLFNPTTSAGARDEAVANVSHRLDLLEEGLADGRAYLLGESFSVADAYLFVICSWAEPSGVKLALWPALSAHQARVAERPSVKQARAAEAQPVAA